MIVQCRLHHPTAFLETGHHCWNFELGEDEISHYHGVSGVQLLEGDPGSQSKGRLEADSVQRDVQITSREAEFHYAIRLKRTGASHGRSNCRPVGLRGWQLSARCR